MIALFFLAQLPWRHDDPGWLIDLLEETRDPCMGMLVIHARMTGQPENTSRTSRKPSGSEAEAKMLWKLP
jgi:hypothetical protein